MSRATLIPLFAGKTPEGEKIVLYKSAYSNDEAELHILRPDGEVLTLSSGAKLKMGFDIENYQLHLSIESPEWTGTAVGTREELMAEKDR